MDQIQQLITEKFRIQKIVLGRNRNCFFVIKRKSFITK